MKAVETWVSDLQFDFSKDEVKALDEVGCNAPICSRTLVSWNEDPESWLDESAIKAGLKADELASIVWNKFMVKFKMALAESSIEALWAELSEDCFEISRVFFPIFKMTNIQESEFISVLEFKILPQVSLNIYPTLHLSSYDHLKLLMLKNADDEIQHEYEFEEFYLKDSLEDTFTNGDWEKLKSSIQEIKRLFNWDSQKFIDNIVNIEKIRQTLWYVHAQVVVQDFNINKDSCLQIFRNLTPLIASNIVLVLQAMDCRFKATHENLSLGMLGVDNLNCETLGEHLTCCLMDIHNERAEHMLMHLCDENSLTTKTLQWVLRDALFKKNYERIHRAINNWYISLCSFSYQSQYLLAITSIESLFDTSNSSISQTLAGSISILYPYNERKTIYEKLTDLYKLRSDIVHGNKNIAFNEEKTEALKSFSSNSIFRYIRLAMILEELSEPLPEDGINNIVSLLDNLSKQYLQQDKSESLLHKALDQLHREF